MRDLAGFIRRVWTLLQEDYPYLRRVGLRVVSVDQLLVAGFEPSSCFVPKGIPVWNWALPGTPPLVYALLEEEVWRDLLDPREPRWQVQAVTRWVARRPFWLRLAFALAHEAGHALLYGDASPKEVAAQRLKERAWVDAMVRFFGWPYTRAYASTRSEYDADAFAGGWVRLNRVRIRVLL